MKPIFACIVALLAIATADQEKATAPVVKDIAKTYRQMRAVTTQPVYVDPGLMALCRGPSQNQIESAKKKNGPHAISRIKIYMNDPGAQAFEKSAKEFPVGSVIVKEKGSAPDGVGGMVKRPPG